MSFLLFFFGIFSIEQLLRRTDVDKDGFLRTVVNALPFLVLAARGPLKVEDSLEHNIRIYIRRHIFNTLG